MSPAALSTSPWPRSPKTVLILSFAMVQLLVMTISVLSQGDGQAVHLSASVLALLLGILVFWFHGGSRISAAGLYSLASSAFVGFAGIVWYLDYETVPPAIRLSSQVGFWLNMLMTTLWSFAPSRPQERQPNLSVAVGLTTAGSAGAALSIGLLSEQISFGSTVLEQFTIGFMALIMVGFMAYPLGQRPGVLRLVPVAGLVIVFALTVFTGYGRLNLVALGIVGTAALSTLVWDRRVKSVVLVSAPAVLAVLGLMRRQFGLSIYGQYLDGLGSVTQPMRDFGRLVEIHGRHGFSLAGGETFATTALFWVPRALWPEKPIGFGAELTKVLNPDLAAIGQSYAALNQAEWYFNFGWVGVLLMVPVMGLLIRLLDTFWLRATVGMDLASALRFTILTLLVADIPNLMWVGSFGYASRTFIRIFPLVVALALVRLGASGTREPVVLRRTGLGSASVAGAANSFRQPAGTASGGRARRRRAWR
jgi:hypothetical protein